jgi:hypothetical protein
VFDVLEEALFIKAVVGWGAVEEFVDEDAEEVPIQGEPVALSEFNYKGT